MTRLGYEVEGFDVKISMPINIKYHLVEWANVIILAIPSGEVGGVVEEIRGVLHLNHFLINTSSQQVPGLTAIQQRTLVEYAGVHILADVTDQQVLIKPFLLNDVVVVVCSDTRVLSYKGWFDTFIVELGGRVEKTLASSHDELMLFEQNLPRLCALIQGFILEAMKVDSRELVRFETRLGKMSHAVMRRVFEQSGMLDAELLVGNQNSLKLIDALLHILVELRSLVESKNLEGLARLKQNTCQFLGNTFMNPDSNGVSTTES